MTGLNKYQEQLLKDFDGEMIVRYEKIIRHLLQDTYKDKGWTFISYPPTSITREINFILNYAKRNNLPKPKTFLDVGCGVGNILCLVNKIFNFRCVGIERHKNLVKATQDINAEQWDNKIRVKHSLASQYTQYHLYDIVYMYMPFKENVLKKVTDIFKQMRVGSYLIVNYFYVGESEREKMGRYGETLHKYKYRSKDTIWIRKRSE